MSSQIEALYRPPRLPWEKAGMQDRDECVPVDGFV
jgi:hypothetical protein